MKYLNRRPPASSYNSHPYTVEEIDAQDNADRIWATIAEIRREAQEQIRKAYDNGYADGKFDHKGS